MSDLSPTSRISAAEPPAKAAGGAKRRRVALWSAAGALVVVAGVSLWVWQPWVDRSPFTALVSSASPVKDAGAKRAGAVCTPNLAGESVDIYDASGKRKLASGTEPAVGEVLPDSYGDFAGMCFVVTRVEGLPGGEGAYKVQVGGGNLVTAEEEYLRLSEDQQREKLRTMKLPQDGDHAPEDPSER